MRTCVISYGVPAFRVDGKTVAGIAAFKNHLSYVPFSGAVLGQLSDDLDGYTTTKSLPALPGRPSWFARDRFTRGR